MARPPRKNGKNSKRVQMDMPSKSLERLKRLQSITEAASYAEVMRNSLRLYEALINEVDKGHQLLIERDGKVSPYPVFSA